MDTKTLPSKRTGGRSAAVMHSVRTAVEELVKERGRERVTVPMIAERAGVNPTSIYRRWGDLPTLINDIATYRLDPERPLPESGDLRRDLTEWAREIVEHYRKPVNAALLRGGAANAGANESDCLRNRRAEATMFLDRYPGSAVSSDEIIDVVVAPIIYRVIFQPWTLDDQTADTVVGRLFD
ncbi:TetR/AcrR family transcriptional regulator [Diaminobutyricibacter tongyongensis]|uniref:TetR/AcrR family transcriptional regulator n=1 Tax=Leifsonia tongyongensis TaxID=1268043 RepID=A0A6L9XVN0_9MICO|nr:TetR/AcrR family transcriptional regulator [Diaminobutyricibacter tongyongensis]NEN05490.1 TetR/AcrR family transcriptional regulator [Diaminobutyricibacter tongyongensis]